MEKALKAPPLQLVVFQWCFTLCLKFTQSKELKSHYCPSTDFSCFNRWGHSMEWVKICSWVAGLWVILLRSTSREFKMASILFQYLSYDHMFLSCTWPLWITSKVPLAHNFDSNCDRRKTFGGNVLSTYKLQAEFSECTREEWTWTVFLVCL